MIVIMEGKNNIGNTGVCGTPIIWCMDNIPLSRIIQEVYEIKDENSEYPSDDINIGHDSENNS